LQVLAKCPALRHIIFIGKDFVPDIFCGGKAGVYKGVRACV